MAKKPVSYLAGSMVIGTVIGAVVGMLSAPMSGRDARENIKNRARDVSRDLPKRLGSLGSLPMQGRDAFKNLPRPFSRKPKSNGSSTATVDTHALDATEERTDA